jgi:hypothetical protein
MTRRLVGAIAAGTFAIGVLTGGAAAIVARDVTPSSTDMTALMAEHMNGGGTASMVSMMGMMSGSTMGPNASMGPDMMGLGPSKMPGSQHNLHHPAASHEAPE